MSRSTIPVRRCAPCDEDWPNTQTFNLCPVCQRSTYASTSTTRPDAPKAAAVKTRHDKIREFDAKADAAAQQRFDEWAAAMNALLPVTMPSPQDVCYPWQASDNA